MPPQWLLTCHWRPCDHPAGGADRPQGITSGTTDQLVTTLRALDRVPGGPVLLLAGGSNVVISDDMTDLTVVRVAAAGEHRGSTLRARNRCGLG